MARRLVSLFLAALMLFTSLPLTALAEETQQTQTDAPQEVAISEVVTLQEEETPQLPKLEKLAAFYDKENSTVKATKYPAGARLLLAGYTGGQLQFALPDEDQDGELPLSGKTAETYRLFALNSEYAPLCEAIDVSLTQETYKVEFYDGDTLIDTYQVPQGEALKALPDAGDKVGYTFVGYYSDKACTVPFYDAEPVTQDLQVYALYEVMEALQQPEGTAFALLDSTPEISFDIERVSGNGAPENAATLLIIDGSDPVELAIRDNGDGTYTVYAPNGFHEGCSYQLELAEGWNFVGKPEKVRTASFSILQEEVEKLQMNDTILYIQDTDAISYSADGKTYEVLNSETLTENGGTFPYTGEEEIEAGDLLCIYVGTHPEQRETAREMMEPAMYVTVSAYDNGTVTYVPLADENRVQLYNIPDNFPILVDALPDGAGTANLNRLDADTYQLMKGSEGTMAHALENIAVGDFVTMYLSAGTLQDASDVRYGEITAYDPATGEIAFEPTTMDAILSSMDLYMNLPLTGEDLVSDEEAEAMEALLLQQVEESGFAEEAAWALADIVTKTDGFEEEVTLQEFLATDENGNEVSLMNIGGKWELGDVELSVELIRKGDQLHFENKGTVQLAIGVDAEFEVDVENDAKIKIELGATFVEEVGIDPRVKANLIHEKIIFDLIPAIVGVRADAAVDVLNYTAFSFEAKIYTVEAEEQGIWEQLKDIANDPLEALELDKLNPELVKGLKTVGDLMDKVDTLEAELKKFEETSDQYKHYLYDIETLLNLVTSEDRTNWKAWAKELEQSNVTSELLEMKNLTRETELGTDYLDSMEALMDRYSEMINQKSAWVELVDKQIFQFELNYFGLILGVSANFVVRADLSLAVGSNLEYEVGKRFTFWFEIHGFKSDSGSGTMDLIDEHFGFQFYAMGRLGLRAGIRGKIYVALGSAKFASIGIAVELGPYLKMYGFFLYTYERNRPAGSNRWEVSTETAGAIFIEIGVYFLLEVEANAIGELVEWNKTLIDKEMPLVEIGGKTFYYDFVAEPELLTEPIRVMDTGYNKTDNVITMTLPDYNREMKYMDLTTGIKNQGLPKTSDIRYTLSSSAYRYDPETGRITVTVPEGARYIACNLTMTYRRGKAAFSTRDLSITIPLVWHDLTPEQLSEKVNVTVMAGCEKYGYQKAQVTSVVRGSLLETLPEAEAIVAALSEKDPTAPWRYEKFGEQYQNVTNDMVINDDTVFYCDLQRRIHRLYVQYVNSGTNVLGQQFLTHFDEPFDFSSLEFAGAGDHSTGTYRTFAGVKWNMDALKTRMGLTEEPFDLSEPIDTVEKAKMLEDIVLAMSQNYFEPADAVFEDDGATATFRFAGLEQAAVTQTVQKGTMPDLNEIAKLVSDKGMYIARVTPAVGKISSDATYEVICKTASETAVKANVTFNYGYGNPETAAYVVGSVLALPAPARTGYDLAGWYTDEAMTQPCKAATVPNGGLTLYAKWIGRQYPVYFSGYGNEVCSVVTFGQPYGELPPVKYDEYDANWVKTWSLNGAESTIVTPETIVNTADRHTLQYTSKQAKTINLTAKDLFGITTIYYYTGQPLARPPFKTSNASAYAVKDSEFEIRYRVPGTEKYIDPTACGKYELVVTRPKDSYRVGQDCYAAYESVYEKIIEIQPGSLTIADTDLEVVEQGATHLKVKLTDAFVKRIGAAADVKLQYVYPSGVIKSVSGTSAEFTNLFANSSHTIRVVVEPNSDNFTNTGAVSKDIKVKTANPKTDKWINHYDTAWYKTYISSGYSKTTNFEVSTPEQLAAVIYAIDKASRYFNGKTVTLTADLDLSAYAWTPNTYNEFRGVFEGGDHTISGMFVPVDGAKHAGLFGKTRDAVIRNVTVKDFYAMGVHSGVGGIVGNVNGYKLTVENCHVINGTLHGGENGQYSGAGAVGGILGMAYNSSDEVLIKDCTATNVNILYDIAPTSTSVGGAGGIFGANRSESEVLTITGCKASGTVASTRAANVGGIAGNPFGGTVTDCTDNVTVTVISSDAAQ